ncbi:MAG TPA: pentapeptide repeat-containing protein [Dehalococcoidales bacterium]|nr:pentapeptide repeat-containing protein [Dehalococcoidales bacterium]
MPFEQKYYYQEKFNKLAVTRAVYNGLSFEECEFWGCHLIDCKFEKSRFLRCVFRECILSAIIPMNCRLDDVKFLGSKAIGIDWTKSQRAHDLEFSQTQINYSNFRLMPLTGIKITHCEAKEADFTEADLSGGDFQGTDFEKSRFFKTNLADANFKGARNYFIDVKNNILKKTRFSMPEALNLLQSLDIILD